MANKFYYREGPKLLTKAPVGSGVQIEIGEMLKISSGKVTPVATSTDNLAFCGLAAERHSTTDASTTIQMYMPLPNTVFEIDLDAASDLVIGGQLQIEDSQTLTVSTTDAIASTIESKLQATAAMCVFKLPQHTNGFKLVGDAS